MKYGAYIQLDRESEFVKIDKTYERSVSNVPYEDETLAKDWLLKVYGSIATEIILFDAFGECVKVK